MFFNDVTGPTDAQPWFRTPVDNVGREHWIAIEGTPVDNVGDTFELNLDSGYIASWPPTGDGPPPWRRPHTPAMKAQSRWRPPRCTLPALVPRRDFPNDDP